MSVHANPRGGQIRALERNIVTYRAIQMALVIFYAEQLQGIIVSSVTATDRIKVALKADGAMIRLPAGTKNIFKKACKIWVSENLLSEKEVEEIKALIEYRNHVAHRMEQLTADVSTHRWTLDVVKHGFLKASYDYDAPSQMRSWISKLNERLSGTSLYRELTFDSVLFDTAEKAMMQELKSLDKKIAKLVSKRNAEIKTLRTEINAIYAAYRGDRSPSHPTQTKRNGNLTDKGVQTCFRLFEEGYSIEAIAYSFHISLASISRRYRKWEMITVGS